MTDVTLSQQEKQDNQWELPTSLKVDIDHWLSKYPKHRRQSAIIPGLLLAQKHTQGWLRKETIEAVARYIGVPITLAYEVATFYSLFELKPIGTYKICVCTNISCMLNNSEKIVAYLKQRLKIGFGETTQNKRFTLKEVECLGACVKAPVLSINDTLHDNVTVENLNNILENLDKSDS